MEPIEVGQARLEEGNPYVPYVKVHSTLNEKLALELFQQQQFTQGGFTYLKSFNSVNLLLNVGKKKGAISFSIDQYLTTIAGMMGRKTVVIDHEKAGADKRVILDLTDAVASFILTWEDHIIPELMLPKLKQDGISHDQFPFYIQKMKDYLDSVWGS